MKQLSKKFPESDENEIKEDEIQVKIMFENLTPEMKYLIDQIEQEKKKRLELEKEMKKINKQNMATDMKVERISKKLDDELTKINE